MRMTDKKVDAVLEALQAKRAVEGRQATTPRPQPSTVGTAPKRGVRA